MTMCPVQTLCIYGDTRRSLDTLWMAEWLQPPLYLPRKELFSELCLEIILKCSQRLQLAGAGGCWQCYCYDFYLSDIRYQASAAGGNDGANEPLELASGELQLETTRVTEKCV